MKQMKHLVCAFFILAAALFSCGRPGYPPGLVAADSLSEVNPDSAMAVLGSVERGLKAMDDDALWYYRLLRLKVRGKAYEAFSRADSTEVFAVLDHYRRRGDRHLLPQAYYYAGCVVRDIGNAPMAIDLFQQGMDAMADTTDLKLRSILNFQTGFLLFEQRVYAPAVNYFKESLRLERLRKDTAMMAYCYEKLAFVYCANKMNDSTLYYFDQAQQCAESLGDSIAEKGFVASKALYYISIKDYDKADCCLEPYMTHVQNSDFAAMYCMYAITRLYKKDYDQVVYLCDFLLKSGNVYQKKRAYHLLTVVNYHRGNLAKALDCISNYEYFSDSVDALKSAEIVARMNASYNYNKYVAENAELKVERMYYILCVFVVVIIASAIFIRGLFVYKKNKRRLKILEEARLNMQRQSEAYISENNAKLVELEHQLSEAKQENEEMFAALTRQKLLLEANLEVARQKHEMVETAKKHIVSSATYRHVCNLVSSGAILTDADWNNIESLLLGIRPNFKAILYGIYNISVQEYHLCMLLKIGGFSGKQMASLMGRTDSAISKAKRKLHDLFVGEADDATLEEFVNSL